MTTLHDFTATGLDGVEHDLSQHAGSLVLVVNTASQCGFAPQLEGLQRLWEDYRHRGLVVLGFPCNQFGHQEPGGSDAIEECIADYGVTFPMFAKVEVNGVHAHPLWAWLRTQKGGNAGNAIKWNFTKFLVAPDGTVLDRYAPTTRPEVLVDAIAANLPR